MKFVKYILVIALFAMTVAACKKSAGGPASPSNGIEGLWEGKFGIDNEKPTVFFSFNIKAGGVIEELTSTGQVKGQGTWKLENNILTAKYSYLAPSTSKYSIIAAFDGAKGKLAGNWGYGNSATDGGLWDMTKK